MGGTWRASHVPPGHLTAFRVLDAAGDPRAAQVVAAAGLLLRMANGIHEGAARSAFLEAVPDNRALMASTTNGTPPASA